jgi:hypothetical protein
MCNDRYLIQYRYDFQALGFGGMKHRDSLRLHALFSRVSVREGTGNYFQYVRVESTSNRAP